MQRDILDYLTWATVALIAIPFAVFAFPQLLTFSESHIVRSDSVEDVSQGSVIFANPADPSEVSKGDMIVYKYEGNGDDVLVAHEVSDVQNFGQETQFKISSIDPREDFEWIADYQVDGEVGLVVPMMGHVVDIMNLAIGKILIIVMPATLLVLNELRRMAEMMDSNEMDLMDRIKS